MSGLNIWGAYNCYSFSNNDIFLKLTIKYNLCYIILTADDLNNSSERKNEKPLILGNIRCTRTGTYKDYHRRPSLLI